MFLSVFSQVAILFLLIFVGALLTKFKVLNEVSVKGITDLVILVVTPCVIVKSFFREFSKESLKGLIISSLIAFLAHICFIILSKLLIKDKNEARQSVLRFGAIFSNCGFMSLPLQQALLGDEGVFYASSFIVIFNALIWSYGVVILSGDKKYLSFKKLIVNQNIIALLIGLIIFFTSLPLPNILVNTVTHLTNLNTPLPMIIIGYHLMNSDVLKGITDLKCLYSIALRLIVFPLVVLGLMYLVGIKGPLFISLVISCCAPVAALTTMLSARYNSDTELSANMVAISTLMSIITMPPIITLAEHLA